METEEEEEENSAEKQRTGAIANNITLDQFDFEKQNVKCHTNNYLAESVL